MPEPYRIALKISVFKGETEETLVTEEFFFPEITFAKMTHISDGIYELVAKLQKEK